MTVRTETIEVKGAADHEATLKYTRHGPVVYEDAENNKAYALRAAWLEIGNSPYLASLRMDQAQTWEEFVEACNYSGIPAENMIWGDVDGNIGYQAVGVSPIRNANWSGLVPVPGDGRYEWQGYLPIKALPAVKNPEKGFWGTANNLMAPAVASHYPHPEALHFTWGDEMRGLRVDELMRNGQRHTVQDMMAYQHDELSVVARNLVPLLMQAEPPESAAMAALADWDFVMDKDSVAATIYLHFERRVSEAMRELFIPEAARGLVRGVNKKRMLDHLMAPLGQFGDDPITARDALLVKAFADGVQDVTDRLGADMANWHYGQNAMKHVHITHYMAQAVNEEDPAAPRGRPLPAGRLRVHGQQHRRQRQPAFRGQLPRHPGPVQLGQLHRDERPRPVRRPDEPALPRPLRALGPQPVLPARLHARQGRVGDGTPASVEPVVCDRGGEGSR